MTIRAVIFDFGGVLVRTQDDSLRRAWEKRLGLAPGEIDPIVFDSETARLAGIGAVPLAEHERWLGQRLNLSPDEVTVFLYDFFAGDQADPELIALIQGLRPRYKTGLISNCWPGLRDRLNHFGLDHLFDVAVLSYEAGIGKPHERIYRLALEPLGVAPDEAVFIDDFPRNVEGARALGIHAIQFRDTPSLKAELAALLADMISADVYP